MCFKRVVMLTLRWCRDLKPREHKSQENVLTADLLSGKLWHFCLCLLKVDAQANLLWHSGHTRPKSWLWIAVCCFADKYFMSSFLTLVTVVLGLHNHFCIIKVKTDYHTIDEIVFWFNKKCHGGQGASEVGFSIYNDPGSILLLCDPPPPKKKKRKNWNWKWFGLRVGRPGVMD